MWSQQGLEPAAAVAGIPQISMRELQQLKPWMEDVGRKRTLPKVVGKRAARGQGEGANVTEILERGGGGASAGVSDGATGDGAADEEGILLESDDHEAPLEDSTSAQNVAVNASALFPSIYDTHPSSQFKQNIFAYVDVYNSGSGRAAIAPIPNVTDADSLFVYLYDLRPPMKFFGRRVKEPTDEFVLAFNQTVRRLMTKIHEERELPGTIKVL